MFINRAQAAQQLAGTPILKDLSQSPHAVILGIPRGGVVMAAVLCRELSLPLGFVSPRKITAPGNPEYALGAVGERGQAVWNKDSRELYSLSDRKKMELVARREAGRRNKLYGAKASVNPRNKIVVLVDDGLATGMTMLAAAEEVRQLGARRIIVAVPVAPPDTIDQLKGVVDEVVVLETPDYFAAVGQFYREFPQVSDEEVLKLLKVKRSWSS